MTVYLKSFTFPSYEKEITWSHTDDINKYSMTCYNSFYPFSILSEHAKGVKIPLSLEFSPITIFYGDNGSGKSTAINIISEKLNLYRESEYNQTDFFADYLELCTAHTHNWNSRSRVITSDDIFNNILYLRRTNEEIDRERQRIMDEIIRIRGARNYSNSHKAMQEEYSLKGLDDLEKYRYYREFSDKSASQLIRERVSENRRTHSNGETARAFFADRITRNALYILDEPENSLSVQSQMMLYDFLLEAVRFYNCQLIIATHSPFLLALPDAKIYDFDAHPMTTRSWEKLKGVKTVFNFFWDRREQFVTGSKSTVNGENNE